MAEMAATLVRVREELTCAVCQELFNVPKTLPCLHTFCMECLIASDEACRKLRRVENALMPGQVECPQCRAISEPPKGIEGIMTNFTYSTLVEHVQIHDQVMSDKVLRCGKCKDDVDAPAVAFCYDCRAALCDFCHKMHQRSKDLAVHTFCLLEDIKQAKNVEIPTVQHVHRCEKHNEELKLYCFTCEKVICRDCTITPKDHRDHSFAFITEVVLSEKEQIQECAEPLKSMLQEVVEASERIKDEIKKLEDIQHQRMETINKQVNMSVEMLEKRREFLKDEAKKIFHYKSKNLGLQLEELETSRASLSSALEFASTTLEKASDVEVLMYKRDFLARSDTLKLQHSSLPFDVREEDNVQFVYNPESLARLGRFCEAPFAENCTGEGEGLKEPIQNEDALVTVTAYGAKGQRLYVGGGTCSVEVSCTPKSTGKLEKVKGSAIDNMDGTYTALYKPLYPGASKVTIKFSDKEIKGSPCDVTVVRNYSDITPEPYVFTIPNASPWGLAMITETELAISASDCMVHIYDIDGTETDTIRSNFTRPYGIATDKEGYLWITDREAHNVHKFQRVSGGKWERILQFGQRGVNAGQFSHPRGITIHPTTGYIYISDMKNNRIQIFKPDPSGPKYHAQFGSPGKTASLFNLPAGLCFDRKDRLIVCDDHNCRLQVFNPDGRFLYTLGTTSAQKGLLCSPIGVASDTYGRYIVTEFGSHCVSFLTPEGEILSCVRTIGKGFGQFVHPRGVAVDSVGYVYVADNENMRIVRF